MLQLPIKNDGFGVAYRRIRKSIEKVGINLVEDANISFNFCHPHESRYSDGYDIIYFPWESSQPLPGWRKHLSLFEEVWVTSPWMKPIVEEWGFKVEQVYEHGVEPVWIPNLRKQGKKTIFLMQGFEAMRKGGWESIHAFNNAFRGRNDVELWIKTSSRSMKNMNYFPNTKFITENLKIHELVHLYQQANIMLAPTYGEGFGLPTRDAMATGMPVITTAGFLPYEKFLHKDLMIPSTIIESPWPNIHPGTMYKPDVDALQDIMIEAVKNYDDYAEDAFLAAPTIHTHYNWDILTKDAFFALEQRTS